MITKILIICIVVLPTFQQCNITHYEFFSKYSLGKLQQVNQTCAEIEPLIKISNITYNQTSYKTYTLYNFKLHLNYLDSNQSAYIIKNDTIDIFGGRLEVAVQFNWTQQTIFVPTFGYATATVTSQQILYEKQILTSKGFIEYNLTFCYDINFNNSNVKILKFEPPTATQEMKQAVYNALNGTNDSASLTISFKLSLQNNINQIFPSTLKKYIRNQHYPLDDHFDYVYFNKWSNRTININFLMFPTAVHLTQIGLSLSFVSNIKDDSKWKCGKLIPIMPRDITQYGGLQQFLSFSIIQNTVRYAFQNHYLDTVLNQNNWESSFFQFFAGDLYEIIPQVAHQFFAREKVLGQCTANTLQQPIVKRYSNSSIIATLFYNCNLSIIEIKVASFQIKLDLVVELSANETHVHFKVIEVQGVPIFSIVSPFQVTNIQLAQLMVRQCLGRLKEGYTFGSEWKTFPRDYPHTLIEEDYFMIYDSSHIGKVKQPRTMMKQ